MLWQKPSFQVWISYFLISDCQTFIFIFIYFYFFWFLALILSFNYIHESQFICLFSCLFIFYHLKWYFLFFLYQINSMSFLVQLCYIHSFFFFFYSALSFCLNNSFFLESALAFSATSFIRHSTSVYEFWFCVAYVKKKIGKTNVRNTFSTYNKLP